MTAPYQLLPPLTAELRAALRADIAARGVMIPVELDENGAILDGHHRAAIAAELGIDYPTIVREGWSEAQKRDHVYKINILHRQLGTIGWAHAVREMAVGRGIRLGSPGRQKADTLSALAAELGVSTRTARRRFALADALADAPDLAAALDAEEIDGRRALRLARERVAIERAHAPISALPATCDLRLGDFEEVLADVPDGSVDLVLTDPPYMAADMPAYSALARFARRVLKPETGTLYALVGQSHLPEAITRLGEHLPYRWTLSYRMTGAHLMMHGLGFWVGWKPVLVYGAPPKASGHLSYDVVDGGGRDKRYHEWGQSETGFSTILDRISAPGMVVCDPFVGGGTTAVVALAHGCSFIGAERDPIAHATAARRIVETMAEATAEAAS